MTFTEVFKNTGILKLVSILSLIAVVAVSATVTSLYYLMLEQESRLLAESLDDKVTLLHTMQQMEETEQERDENSGGMLILNVIKKMQGMNQAAEKRGNSIEYAVAKLKNDQINFMLFGVQGEPFEGHSLHHKQSSPSLFSVPLKSTLAEPMRLALLHKTGTVIGLDHHGTRVLAAYQYMPEYDIGLVVKVNISELLKPYLFIALLASVVAIIFVCIGAYFFVSLIKPFFMKQKESTERYIKQHELMSRLVEKKDVDPCDMQKIFETITEAACTGLKSSRVSIWLDNDDHSKILCADSYDAKNAEHTIFDDMEVSKYPEYFKALNAGKVIVERDAAFDPRTSEFAKDYLIPQGTQALLDLTIWVDGEIFGHLCNEQIGEERQWSLEDQRFAHNIADHISLAVSNCRRNKAEQSLKESELRYELAVAGSSDGLWDWDLKTNFVYRSPQFKRMLGYEINEFDDDHDAWLLNIEPEGRKAINAALHAHFNDADIPYDVEYRQQTKSGEYRWYRCRGIALRDEDGKPVRISGSITDINDLKKIQDNLSRFKQTLDQTVDMIFMFDPVTLNFFYVNMSAIDNTGYSEAEFMQMTPLDIKPNFTAETFKEFIDPLVTGKKHAINFETVQSHKNGSLMPVDIHLQYVEPLGGRPRFVALVRDVSERKASESEKYVQRTMLEHIFSAQEQFISGNDRVEVFRQLLSGVLDITESELGVICEVVEEAGPSQSVELRCSSYSAHYNQKNEGLASSSLPRNTLKQIDNLLSKVARSGELVILNSLSKDEVFIEDSNHASVASFMGIPLKLGDKLIAVVGIANRKLAYTADTVQLLQPMLSTVMNVIEAEKTETLRYAMENALRNSEEKANSVLATVADGIVTISELGIVESFNFAAENIFGYKAKEVLGKNINMLMPEPYHSAHDGYLEHYMWTGEAHIIGIGREVDGKRKDGSVFPMDLSVSEVQLGDERRFTGVVRDISERKQAEISLIAAKDDAEQANRAKSEFLSSMSHELRTPLNAIMGFAQLLQYETTLTTQQAKHATQIFNAGNLLLALINDVLDLAKIEAGHVNLSIEAVNIEIVIVECIRLVKPQAMKNGIKLSTDVDETCKGLWILADKVRIKQVLLNLLSNAIKYNRTDGSVIIRCENITDRLNRISIKDSGTGIKEQNLDKLFQSFNRLGAERSDIQGTGIGLVITRKLVELMGGSISVESSYGEGTTFMVDIPLTTADIEPALEAVNTSTPLPINNHEGKSKGRILIAEDNEINQQLITLQLNTLGYTADVAANGHKALEMLHNNNYVLLLTDIHMPEMDGYQLTDAIRHSNSSNIKNIIIIAITANAEIDEARHCKEKGMNDYLSKPVDLHTLKDKFDLWLADSQNVEIDASLDKSEIEQDVYKKDSVSFLPISIKTDSSKAIDEIYLSQYIGSDPDKQRHFLKLFLDTLFDKLNNLHQAYNVRSNKDVKNVCHNLKSSSRAVGALNLSAICKELEFASNNDDWSIIENALPRIELAMHDVEAYINNLLNFSEKEVKVNIDDALIVDDDDFVIDLMTSRLKKIGINNIVSASSGEEAMDLINDLEIPPSILLLDLNMPGMDGIEFLRHLAAKKYTGHIILISAEEERLLRSAENIARDRGLNMLGALEKPIIMPQLTKLLSLVGG